MEQDNPIGMLIGRMIQEVFRALRKRTGEQTETKLTGEQFGLLYAINLEEKEVIQKDMAEVMCRDKSAILRMIDLLEEKELVRRVVDRNDRRKNYIMVTKKGERVIEQYLDIEFQLTKELKEGLSEPEWNTFCRVITHIRKKAEQL